ncbi:MAG: flippase-like domain-containing protein [Coriobacteriales bacterium]|jgi:uncharacterized protein (TIRG00374 family)|nr:flippase-like domain-containing protein [Coriobacteriales bacterium]
MQGGNLRKLIIGVVIVIALSVVLLRGDQFFELLETMQGGAIIPLVLAVLSQLGKYFAQSFAYAAAFRTVGEQRRARDTLPLVFGTFFMNTIAPSLNMAGAGLVIDDSRKRGIPVGRATSAALLMQMSIEGGFLTIMVGGFIVLQFTGHLDPLWLLMLLFVVFLVGGMGGIMIVGRKNPNLVVSILRPVERLVNRLSMRFRKGKEIKPWAQTLVESFSEAAGTIGHNPHKAMRVFLFSIVASLCELVCFCLVGVAFGLDAPSALIGGYVVATLFAMISITPQGVGVVEVATVTLLAAYGVSTAVGTAVALVYRGLVFWMPFAIGAVLIHRTRSFASGSKKQGEKHPELPAATAADPNKRLAPGRLQDLLPEHSASTPDSDRDLLLEHPASTPDDNKNSL